MMKHRGDTLSSVLVVDAEDILCDILSRIRVKPLMRFKCVCKRWQNLIKHNPYFIELHFTRSKTRPRRLLLANCRQEHDYFERRIYFLLGNLFENKAAIDTITNSFSTDYSILGPVNGLVCLVKPKDIVVSIYNLSTREITLCITLTMYFDQHDWPGDFQVFIDYSRCEFGFDPVTKEHKVIWVYKKGTILQSSARDIVKSISYVTVCEVLTVGNNSRRRIDEVPPYDFKGLSVYANGSIYWMVKCNMVGLNPKQPEAIVAFDVGSEKFRVIRVPNFILDQPPCDSLLEGRCVDLIEVAGRVALLHRISYGLVKLWIFDDEHKKEMATTMNTASTSSSNWIEETITLPFQWGSTWDVYFHAVGGTDEIIVVRRDLGKTLSVHSYDRKKKTFKKLEINGISDQTLPNCVLIKPFVESLFPIQKQKQHHSIQPPCLRL